jgi:hypothetical protein
MPKAFSSFVAESIGWYVYALQDPRDNKIFYIGKGKDSRVFAHAEGVLPEAEFEANSKNQLIKEILVAGREVNTYIIRHGLKSEQIAFAIESALIDFCDFLDPQSDNALFSLKNLVSGHNSQLATTDVVISRYQALPAPDLNEAILLFRPTVLWRPTLKPEDLFEITHGWWEISPQRAQEARYAFAVCNFVIRGVYRIDSWRQQVPSDRGWSEKSIPGKRWGFEGGEAPEMSHFLNKSVAHLYKKGDRTQFRYFNC